jgi:hypothetical protein
MMTIDAGAPGRGPRGAGTSLSPTRTVSPARSTWKHEMGLSAGAPSGWPVRRSKQAWCHGQRTVSPTTSPSASGPL